MYVNPFWLGFLMGIVAMIVLTILISMVSKRNEDEYEPISLEDLKEVLREENSNDQKDH